MVRTREERITVTATSPAPSEVHGHQHRDVSGGWLRPAVFGAMDGLVANVSLAAFAVGALIPLLPYLAGFSVLPAALGLAALAAFIGGGLVARLTDRPFLRGALRQLLLGAAAAGITYLIGLAVGAAV